MKKLLLVVLLLAGCAPTVGTSMPISFVESEMSIRYLALGDSYTIGESVAENERFPNQLASLLEKKGYTMEVSIVARTGWTTSELWAGIQNAGIHPKYDLVSLLIGVNNQYRGFDADEYREEFRFLLGKSIEYAGGDVRRVFIFSIPDWSVTPFASGRDSAKIASEIDLFNTINQEQAEAAGAQYVDITPISRRAVDLPSLIAADGLHPSAEMYAQWAAVALPKIIEVLK